MSFKKAPFFGPLGADYDTAWARRPWARTIRFLMIEGITRPVIKMLAHPKFVSRDRVEKLEGPLIFAINHSSHLDTSLIMAALPRHLRDRTVVAAGSDYFFNKRFKAFVWSLWYGIIPLERDKVSRSSIETAAAMLEDGWSLVLFPEGTRGKDDFLIPFKPGAAFLSIKTGVPVLPIHLEGTRRIFTPYTGRIRIGRTRVTFGHPMLHQEGERAREFNDRIENAVAAAADEGRTDWWSAAQRAANGTTPSLRAPEDLTGWRRAWASNPPSYRRPSPKWPLGKASKA